MTQTRSILDVGIARTRLAPSPTGALHLGNARSFVLTWVLARQRGWRIVLRIEDLDTPRVKAGSMDGILRTFEWLGIDYDEGPIVQSADLEPHVEAMRVLAGRGAAYPCDLTRQQVEAAASAPHGEDAHETPFPVSLRPEIGPRAFSPGGEQNWRFVTPEGPVRFRDEVYGEVTREPAASVGDFVIWTRRRQPSYQLAVVVDDDRQGVTHVVRGADLVDSAARQLLLYRELGLSREPEYTHLPLVLGPDGKRLAKRHGDSRVETYRARGAPAEAVIGLIAHWSGVTAGGAGPGLMSMGEVLDRFRLATLPAQPVVFTPEQDRWLLSHAE